VPADVLSDIASLTPEQDLLLKTLIPEHHEDSWGKRNQRFAEGLGDEVTQLLLGKIFWKVPRAVR
jgi:hypothetical protein